MPLYEVRRSRTKFRGTKSDGSKAAIVRTAGRSFRAYKTIDDIGAYKLPCGYTTLGRLPTSAANGTMDDSALSFQFFTELPKPWAAVLDADGTKFRRVHDLFRAELCSAESMVPSGCAGVHPDGTKFRNYAHPAAPQRHTHGSEAAVGLRCCTTAVYAVGLRTTAFYAAAADFVPRHSMPLQRTS
jgi:hypothetical protein